MNSRSTTIWEIPFPSVTICNMNQAMKNVAQNMSVGSLDEFMLNNICGTENINFNPHEFNVKWSQYQLFLQQVPTYNFNEFF